MTARNPLTLFIRRLARIDLPHSSFAEGYLSSFDNFELLPAAAVAAGTSKLLLANTGSVNAGTNTWARATKGGVLITTTTTTPTSGDANILTGVTNTPMQQAISTTNTFRLQTTVNVPTITSLLVQAGFGQAPSSTNPGAANSGTDSAEFFFDPTNALSSGATVANWILRARGSSGTVTYSSTSVPVTAGRDYDLAIEMGTGLKPKFYIDGVLVSDSTSSSNVGAITLAATTQICQFGVKTLTAATRSLEIRYAKVNRMIG